jgi:hypothetical protein
MKVLLIILNLIIAFGCNENGNKAGMYKQDIVDSIVIPKPCNVNYDSILIKYSNNFRVTAINLNKCMTQEFQSFILKADLNCLEKQNEYKNFIAIILAKLYLHHLQCCNQGYDLLSMKEGTATFIINAFEKLAGYNGKNLEMLNSGTIVYYIDKEPSFKGNKTVQRLRENIRKEVKRIEKGSL